MRKLRLRSHRIQPLPAPGFFLGTRYRAPSQLGAAMWLAEGPPKKSMGRCRPLRASTLPSSSGWRGDADLWADEQEAGDLVEMAEPVPVESPELPC